MKMRKATMSRRRPSAKTEQHPGIHHRRASPISLLPLPPHSTQAPKVLLLSTHVITVAPINQGLDIGVS